jgi:hypothetical protein
METGKAHRNHTFPVGVQLFGKLHIQNFQRQSSLESSLFIEMERFLRITGGQVVQHGGNKTLKENDPSSSFAQVGVGASSHVLLWNEITCTIISQRRFNVKMIYDKSLGG